MEESVQRFDFNEITTKDGHNVNISGIVKSPSLFNGNLSALKKNIVDIFSKRNLIDLIPIIEDGNENGAKLISEIIVNSEKSGLQVDDLKIIILSSSTNGKAVKPSKSKKKFDTARLENMVIKKKKSFFSKLFRR